MCIVANPVSDVSDTNIFVSPSPDGTRQCVVYGMNITRMKDQVGRYQKNAMILPVPADASEIELHDLSEWGDFFDRMKTLMTYRSRSLSKSYGASLDSLTLEVHQVGSYKVSIVPTPESLVHLDDLFVLSEQTAAVIHRHYPRGFSFVVAQLDADGEYHPLGYSHPLFEGNMFIPTRHEHGDMPGNLPHWDHDIYVTGALPLSNEGHPSVNNKTGRFPGNSSVAQVFRDTAARVPEMAPYLSPMPYVFRYRIKGPANNRDLIVKAVV